MSKSNLIGTKKITFAGIILSLLALSACQQTAKISPSTGPSSSSGQSSLDQKAGFSQFPDIPIPQGAQIDVDNTLVFGSNPWIGRLTINAPSSVDALFDFYQQGLSRFNWRELTSVRAKTSNMTHIQDNRILVTSIQPDTLLGSVLTITASPMKMSVSPTQPTPAITRGESLMPPG